MEEQQGKTSVAPVCKEVSSTSNRYGALGLSSFLPKDFGYWKLGVPAVGLLGAGVYVGFRKQVRRAEEESLCIRLILHPIQ